MVMGLPKEVDAKFKSYTRDQMIISITAVIIGIVFIAGIALLLSQKSNNNVKSIVKGIKRLEKGDFTARLDLQFNDERV